MAVPTMSAKEVVTMDDMQKSGETPKDILAKLQRERAKRGEDGPGRSAVYNFLSGMTHRCDMVETGAANLKCRGGMQPPFYS